MGMGCYNICGVVIDLVNLGVSGVWRGILANVVAGLKVKSDFGEHGFMVMRQVLSILCGF